ncbi:MAG: DUF411 domain-containing protein [Pseudomonadota bacterium]
MLSKKKPARPPQKPRPAPQAVPKELKIALLVALPLGVAAALAATWSSLFPVPQERLVEVVWKHGCTCARGWMQSLRAEGFVVRDFELDDLSSKRRQWQVPESMRGCHPASYIGYFLEGHISAEMLRRLSREHPQAIGVQQLDTVKPDREGKPKITNSQIMLIDRNGAATAWP